jgi:hypothetical protein
MKSNTTVQFELQDVAFYATGYYLPGRPAQVSGPPEHCYPEEPPEFDFCTLKALVTPGVWVNAIWALETSLYDDLIDAAIEAIEAESVDDWFGGYDHDK